MDMKLSEIFKLCDQASPAPWTADEWENIFDANGKKIAGRGGFIREEDENFVIQARTLLPLLARELKNHTLAEAIMGMQQGIAEDFEKRLHDIAEYNLQFFAEFGIKEVVVSRRLFSKLYDAMKRLEYSAVPLKPHVETRDITSLTYITAAGPVKIRSEDDDGKA